MSTSITISVNPPIRFSQDQSKLEEALLQGSGFEQNLTHDRSNRANLATVVVRQRLRLGVWERDQIDRLEKERWCLGLSEQFPFKFYERVRSVFMGLKFLNPPPKPKFQFLTAHDPNPTNHTIRIHPLGFRFSGFSQFGQVNWLTG